MSMRGERADLADTYTYWRGRIEAHAKRRGPMAIVITEEIIGREGAVSFLRDGEPADLFLGFTMLAHRKWAVRTMGRPWFTARLSIARDGSFGDPVCEYDRPPAAEKLRTLGNYVADLELYPRPPELCRGG